jgi:small subunit ribosomal protein S20
MPHTPSAKKHIRKTEKRRLRNRVIKKTIRTHCKRVVAAVAEGNGEKINAELILAVKRIDKAAAKRVIHPNMAARKKSQLARLVNAKAAAKPPEQKPAT